METLTPAGRVIAEEIATRGPILFSRFMELALYHPEHGYYRRSRDPFGVGGDFYTAEQLQPVFGRLIAAVIRDLQRELGMPAKLQVVELGAGRREMAQAFAEFDYTPVDIGFGALPDQIEGVVFSNEFFDAIPVDLIANAHGQWWERRVALQGDTFIWEQSQPARVDDVVGGERVRETQQHRQEWLATIAAHLRDGFVLTIDYGYTHRELVRFPEGTLMSYRRHRASEAVLEHPGEQDITAHVDFTDLQEQGKRLGLETVRYESLAQLLLRAGEPDSFASALSGETEAERLRHRMQLKSLLFGMGETFRVLLQRKAPK